MNAGIKRKLILKYTLLGLLVVAIVSFILYGKDNFDTLTIPSKKNTFIRSVFPLEFI